MDRCREPIDIPAVTLLEERRNSTFGNIFMIFITHIVLYELEMTRYQAYSAFTMFVVFSGGSHVLWHLGRPIVLNLTGHQVDCGSLCLAHRWHLNTSNTCVTGHPATWRQKRTKHTHNNKFHSCILFKPKMSFSITSSLSNFCCEGFFFFFQLK